MNVGKVNKDNAYIIPPYVPKPPVKFTRPGQFKRQSRVPNQVIIGMLARHDPLKCHRKAIEVLKYCNLSGFGHFSLVLAGKGVSNTNIDLVRYIEDIGMQKNVLLLGEISNKDEFFSSIDIHLLLSKVESFGLVTVEGLLRSVPCIMSDTGVAQELVDCMHFRICKVDDVIERVAEKVFELVNFLEFSKCDKRSNSLGRQQSSSSLNRFNKDNFINYRDIYKKCIV